MFSSMEGINNLLLSRKHIIEDVTPSLTRLQVDYIEILFAHRYDAYTPIEETRRPFNWLIEQRKARNLRTNNGTI